MWTIDDLSTGETLAIKVWRDAADATALDELEGLVGIDHAHLVRVRDAFFLEESRAPALLMDLAPGIPLMEAFASADAGLRDSLLLQALEGLGELHREGLVHGDIKPDNLVVDLDSRPPCLRIVDYGLVTRIGRGRFRGGTPAYLAPEIVSGERPSAASDLYALGVTFLQACLDRDVPRRTVPANADLPPGFTRIAARLLKRNRRSRLDDAHAAWCAVASGIPGRTELLLPERLPLVGRDGELRSLLEFLRSPDPGAARVIGSEGSGRRRLLSALGTAARQRGWRWIPFDASERPRQVAARLCGRDELLVGTASPSEATSLHSAGDDLEVLASLVARSLDPTPLLLTGLLPASGSSPTERLLSAIERRVAPLSDGMPRVRVVMGAEAAAPAESTALEVRLPPLSQRHIRRLLMLLIGPGAEDSTLDDMSRALLDASGGHPAWIDAHLRDAVAGRRILWSGDTLVVDREAFASLRTTSLEALVDRRLSRLADRERGTLRLLSLEPGGLLDAEIARALQIPRLSARTALRTLRREGWIDRSGPDRPWRCSARGDRELVSSRLDPLERRTLHVALTKALPDDGRRLRHLLRGELREEAVAVGPQQIRGVARQGATDDALRLAREMLEKDWLTSAQEQSLRVLAAPLALACGEPQLAAKLLGPAREASDPAIASEAARHLAQIALLQERPEAALEHAARGAALAGDDAVLTARALAFHAQVALRAGDPKLAEDRAQAALSIADAGPPEKATAWNTLGLAAIRRGDSAGALAHLEKAHQAFSQLDDRRSAALVAVNLANLLTRRGEKQRAGALLEIAQESFRDAGEDGLLAHALTTQGMQLGSRCLHARATRAHLEAERLFNLTGDERRAAAAAGSAGLALFDGGRPNQALARLDQASRHLAVVGPSHFACITLTHAARACHLLGRDRGGRRRLAHAAAPHAWRRAPRERAEIALAFATLHSSRRPAAAIAWADRAATLAASVGERQLEAEAQDVLAALGSARSQKSGGARPAMGLPVDHLTPTEALASLRQAHRARDPLTSARLRLVLAARAADAGDWNRALNLHARAERALQSLEATMTTRGSTLFRIATSGRELRSLSESIENRLASLNRSREGRLASEISEVLDAVSAIGREQRLEDLLERMLDGLLRITPAVAAFIVLRDGPDSLRVATSRDREGQRVALPDHRLSTSLIYEVLATGRHLVVADAVESSDWGGLASVVGHKIRSLACVAFSIGGRREGACYLDGGEAIGAFRPEDLPMIGGFADLCGIAMQNLRSSARNQQQNAELGRELQTQRALSQARLRELRAIRRITGDRTIIGRSPAIEKILSLIEKASNTDLPVLITGESGTGKELVARALHDRSSRAEAPFLALNCASLPEALAESELFGHRRGAFTGADADQPGMFEQAGAGTLFLDEIGELPLALQAKLLRAIQEGIVRPLGSADTVAVDARILAATNRDLTEEVAEGRFREDLYYRLRVLPVHVPPLRERREDIPRLVNHFLEEAKTPRTFSPAAMRALTAARWPGNVRQLRNEVQRALAVSDDDPVSFESLSEELRGPDHETLPFTPSGEGPSGAPLPLKELEARAIRATLKYTGNDRTQAAKLLGISRSTLYEKLRQLD